ncbi:MAG: pyrimidine 5'-nucleotidase [Hirschia sp.]|nr:pyrimidine 5'-nucleotidase [Hirschia sp.]MBF17330.1 pyrimidine 5'-nucleotidase [Hirschia sp.]|tara:strand:+ start:2695 stop:3405 length:711 start_codon:yes stop_codon:yes gene_type:complete
MVRENFADVTEWVFDLDNTLYPAACDLFAQIDERMTAFVMDYLKLNQAEARAVQKKYYSDHGTTLAGLMLHHDMQPDDFLSFVHDIDHSPLDAAPCLKDVLSALPGRKYVYTNGSTCHAEKVTRYMGIDHIFTDMVCIARSDFIPKDKPGAFENFLTMTGIDPNRAAMFEDLSRNLLPAHALGFKTVLITSDKDWSHEPEAARPAGSDDSQPPHVHHVTDDLPDFLRKIAPTTKAG